MLEAFLGNFTHFRQSVNIALAGHQRSRRWGDKSHLPDSSASPVHKLLAVLHADLVSNMFQGIFQIAIRLDEASVQ